MNYLYKKTNIKIYGKKVSINFFTFKESNTQNY
jgi:hypothetical protein